MTPQGDWYIEAGQGMGATLRIASEKEGYTLTDRATYLALQDTLDLEILLDGDASLLNLYHVMVVNPRKWPNVNTHGARAWSDFLMSTEGQELIGKFGIDRYGQPLFFPDANVEEAELLIP
jgi:tungstate transport system substrate-binding protein